MRHLPGLLLLAALAACAERPARTNVLLVSIDTLRPDHLGFHGYPRGTSPHLDALAADALVFEQAIAQAPWTLPSHGSLFTSLYPSVLDLGSYAEPRALDPAVVTLTEVLRDAGYRTFAVTAGGFMRAAHGIDQGFEGYEDNTARWMSAAVERGLAWLDGRDDDAPFFLFLHTYDVHKYEPPEPLRARFAPATPPRFALRRGELARFLQSYDNRDEVRRLSPQEREYVIGLYDAAIASVDAALGTLFDELARRDLLDETLIVVTADHGEELFDHGGSGHGYTLHDENLRVPLLFRHPSLPARRVTEQVRLLDLAPTVVDVLGLAPPPAWQGVSLLPLAAGQRLELIAFSECAHRLAKSARTPSAKYVLHRSAPHEFLYDLAADPHEQVDVAGAAPSLLQNLRHAMLQWCQKNDLLAPAFRSTPVVLGGSDRAELAALGYVGGAPAEETRDAVPWVKLLRHLKKTQDG